MDQVDERPPVLEHLPDPDRPKRWPDDEPEAQGDEAEEAEAIHLKPDPFKIGDRVKAPMGPGAHGSWFKGEVAALVSPGGNVFAAGVRVAMHTDASRTVEAKRKATREDACAVLLQRGEQVRTLVHVAKVTDLVRIQ